MCKHVGFKPSIMVHLPSDGMSKFQMEFHLPFFAIRKCPQPEGSHKKRSIHSMRKWTDVSLTDGESSMSGGQEVYRIHETQVSCVVYGHDEWQWTACAFIDNAHESGDLYDPGELHDGDGKDGEAVVGQKVDGFDEDPIATGLHVSKPIWRPRQYFAKALEVNIKEVSQEWQELIHKMECDIIAYKQSHTFRYCSTSQNSSEPSEEIKRSFNWTIERMQQLGTFINVLSGTLHQWNAFVSLDGGDIDYFSDLQHPLPSKSPESPENRAAGRSLRAIKKTFGTLQNLLQKIELLRDDLSRDFKTLTLRLSLEGRDANNHASFTSTFLIWVLYPITLAASIFSMQASVIPFGLTPFWFLITIFILLGVMCVIYWFMKKWPSWQNEFAVWRKKRQHLGEEEEREYGQSILNIFRSRASGDEESLGARAISGTRDTG
ncbi:hypothetical protein BGZ57DRAFT_913389 [Hyaloscypha finlandica]|nr:hypothetical protein BGZ57DRAFT_913389 [Hyaloscypha finlandica]